MTLKRRNHASKRLMQKYVIIFIKIALMIMALILFFLIYKSVSSEYQEKEIRNSIKQSPPSSTHPVNNCQLMRSSKGEMGCFGCTSGKMGSVICNNAPEGYQPFTPPKSGIGIPYACFESSQGCQLAQ